MFGRPTQANAPDGGQTSLSYNDSPYNSTNNTPSVLELGGWKTPEIFRRYNIIDESDLIRAQEKTEKYLLEEAEKQGVTKQISTAVN